MPQSTLPALLLILASHPVSVTQTHSYEAPRSQINATTRVPFTPLSQEEAKALRRKLAFAIDTQLMTNNDPAAPVSVLEARVRSVKRDESADPIIGASELMTKYVIRASIKLLNGSPRNLKHVWLEIAGPDRNEQFYLLNNTPVKGHQEYRLDIDLMGLRNDPTVLIVKVGGVEFEDGDLWGSLPFLPFSGRVNASERMPARDATPTGDVLNAIKTDTRPVPVNILRPLYTEQARRNRVMGTVRLRVEVDADGSVNQVEVISGLPDWLTEEAVRSVKELKFKPAMKDGKAIAFWIKTEVAFNLR